MITFEKSSPGSGKNLKWLPEMAFQASKFQNFLGGHAPNLPSDSRLQHSSSLPPHTQISGYSHEY